jgi:hypothetical protein
MVTGCPIPGKVGEGVALPGGTGANVASLPARVMTVAGGMKL